MSRHSSGGAYGHALRRIGPDHYRMSWTVDRYYPDRQIRFPRSAHRDTDKLGAERFAKRHNLEVPA